MLHSVGVWHSECGGGVVVVIPAGASAGAWAGVCDPCGCRMLSAVALRRLQMPPNRDGHGELTTTDSAAVLHADQAAGTIRARFRVRMPIHQHQHGCH